MPRSTISSCCRRISSAPAFADPAQYRVRTRYDTDPTNPGLYNGPYRISEVAAGSHIVLEPNPHWTGPPPPFRRITVERSRIPRRSKPTCCRARSTWWRASSACRSTRRWPSRSGTASLSDHLQAGARPTSISISTSTGPILADRRVRQALLLGHRPRGDQRIVVRRQAAGGRQFREPARRRLYRRTFRITVTIPTRAEALLEEAGWQSARTGCAATMPASRYRSN